ncbi:recombinase family protein [uncultured Tateyamaria sp.]|uniref:recombinase family protein n=1 Tax=uncultured Tateyamaria sp. TaxID=455651 RepID=UPI002634551C|nr:recombinase family protein [uncultured Tateyamaria sp.]
MKPCFGYIRVSTKEQADGASLDAQKDAITVFASQNKLLVTRWFEEQETASKAGRPVFEDMRQRLLCGQAEGVIIHRIDRSSRNYTDWAHIDELSQQGIKVFFAADGLDFESTGGRLMADIQMVLAAHYSRNLSFEVKKGLYGRIKQGHYPFKAPLGYLDNGEGQLKTIDPIKGPLVKLAFELYCTGEHSITSLTAEMARRGLIGWGGKPVVRRNIETMLRNPFYIGKMLVRGTLYDAVHEPLIKAGQFQRVKDVKAGRHKKKSTKHKMTYRTLLSCADCNKMLTGERQKAHVYYRCHTYNCPSLSIREDRLTDQLQKRLQALRVSPKNKEYLRRRFHTWLNNTGPSKLNNSVKLRIADASSRLDRLTDLLVDGTITKTDYEVRKQNTDFELANLREEEQKFADSQKTSADLDTLLCMACDLTGMFAALTVPERRDLLKNCTDRIVVRQGEVRLFAAPWIKELKAMIKDEDYQPAGEVFCLPEPAQKGVKIELH